MRNIFIILIVALTLLKPTFAQQITASAKGVASFAESVGNDVAELKNAKADIRKIIVSGQLSRKKQSRAESLFENSDKLQTKLNRMRKKLRSLAASILEKELVGKSATAAQTKKFFRFFNKSANLSNRADTIVSKIANFVVNNPIVPTANFRGSWKTNFGPITFTQNKRDRVNGTYLWSGGGTVTGKVKARRLIGGYRGNGVSGSFVVTMDGSNTSWAGTYTTSDGTLTEAWYANR